VAQNADNRFLALLGSDREFYLPVLEKPHGIRRVSLHEDRAVRAVFQNGFPVRDSSKECCPIDDLRLPFCCSRWRLGFALGSENLRRALLWGHNNLPLL